MPANSEEVAAARLIVEMHRSAGRPKLDRLDMATHDASLDAQEGVSKEQRAKERPAREKAATERRQRIMALYGQYEMEGKVGPPVPPEAVQLQLAAQLNFQYAGDPTAAAYARSMVTDLSVDPQAAFQYALHHESDDKETLLRLFGRMDRDEIDKAVKDYDDHRGSGPTLYARLGLFGKGSWWTQQLSGDARNEVELAAMGVPRNTLERAEVARLQTQQQIRDLGFLGRLFAHGEYSRMVRTSGGWNGKWGSSPRISTRWAGCGAPTPSPATALSSAI